MCYHRSNYKIYKHGGALYMSVYSIFDEYGLDNCKIELVEIFPCTSKMELCRKEGEYIQASVCVNKIIASSTVSEKKTKHITKLIKIKCVRDKKHYLHVSYVVDNVTQLVNQDIIASSCIRKH